MLESIVQHDGRRPALVDGDLSGLESVLAHHDGNAGKPIRQHDRLVATGAGSKPLPFSVGDDANPARIPPVAAAHHRRVRSQVAQA